MKKLYTSGLVNAGAVTLEQAHMQPQSGPGGLQRAPAAEQQLWTYLAQLAAALRAAHVAGCAVGAAGLAPSKLLLTSRVTARIKIGAALLAKHPDNMHPDWERPLCCVRHVAQMAPSLCTETALRHSEGYACAGDI